MEHEDDGQIIESKSILLALNPISGHHQKRERHEQSKHL
jgi:hypothetical protein